MYCLSQFCCFCFRNKVKLKLLHRIKHEQSTFLRMVNDIIPEIELARNSAFSICDDCVELVMEMHTFRQTCIRNNRILVGYVTQLSSAGGKIGNAHVQLFDLKAPKLGIKSDEEIDIDIKEELILDPLQDYDYFCNETACKIEKDEDASEDIKSEPCFDDDLYGKEIVNDIHHEEILDDIKPELEIPVNPSPNNEISLLEHECLQTSPENQTSGYRCEICGKFLKHPRDLKNHELIHTGEKPFKCETCGKGFAQKRYLNNHMKIHTGEKRFICEMCGKGYLQAHHLKEHFLSHTGEKPFKCEICGRRFKFLRNLKVHNSTHSPYKPNKCEHCDKGFSTVQILKQHVMKHTGHKSYKCEICGKLLYTKMGLELHIRIHKGEKPYSCCICGKAFASNCHLKIHSTIHTGQKPFQCEICGKAFANLSYYRRHALVHAKEKRKENGEIMRN